MTYQGGPQTSAQPRHFGCLAALFRPTLIRRLPSPPALLEISEILGATGLTESCREQPLHRVFETAYSALQSHYRCEYLYKNAIAAKILMGKHSVRTAGVLTELQVGDCKLDVMLVNGETVAYEIKTELDSPDRLFNQLCTYQRAFERVYLVTHESCAPRFTSSLPPGVGILQLTNRYSFRTVQAADCDYSRLDPGVIFNMLRRAEYVIIIKKYFGSVPAVPNTRIYTECRRLFLEIPAPNISAELVTLFHERCRNSMVLPYQDVESTPHALMLHALSGNLSRRQYDALEHILV